MHWGRHLPSKRLLLRASYWIAFLFLYRFGGGRVGPQVKKNEQVSTNDHQVAVAGGGGRYPGPMSREGEEGSVPRSHVPTPLPTLWADHENINYRPQRSCGQGNIFTPVILFTGGGGVPDQQTPPRTRHASQTRHPPPTRHAPPYQTCPPWDQPCLQARHPLPGTRHPPGTRHAPHNQTHPPGPDMPPSTLDQTHPPWLSTPPGTKYTPRTKYTPGTKYTLLGLSTPPGNKYTPGSSRLRNTVNERPVRILVSHSCFPKRLTKIKTYWLRENWEGTPLRLDRLPRAYHECCSL